MENQEHKGIKKQQVLEREFSALESAKDAVRHAVAVGLKGRIRYLISVLHEVSVDGTENQVE